MPNIGDRQQPCNGWMLSWSVLVLDYQWLNAVVIEFLIQFDYSNGKFTKHGEFQRCVCAKEFRWGFGRRSIFWCWEMIFINWLSWAGGPLECFSVNTRSERLTLSIKLAPEAKKYWKITESTSNQCPHKIRLLDWWICHNDFIIPQKKLQFSKSLSASTNRAPAAWQFIFIWNYVAFQQRKGDLQWWISLGQTPQNAQWITLEWFVAWNYEETFSFCGQAQVCEMNSLARSRL